METRTDADKTHDAVLEISSAFRELEIAKSDCKDLVESTLDTLAAAVSITKEDRKAIKKVARAMAKDKHKAMQDEAASLAAICEAVAPKPF